MAYARTQSKNTPLHSKDRHSTPEDQARLIELAEALTALKVNAAELLQRKKQLQQLNRWFDVALNNMGRGLSMFDGKQRLIVCNRLYREIYELPPRLGRPGTPLADIVKCHVKREKGSCDRAEIDRQCVWIRDHVSKLTKGKTFAYTQYLRTGRIVQVSTQPLQGGGWVDIQEDITERRKSEKKITWLAHHDPLTGAANRACFTAELEHALRRRDSSGFALHSIDLDRFKPINDALGHPVGDALLKSVVRLLKKIVRDGDLVARLGGDEFAIIQAGVTTAADAEKLAARILAAIRTPQQVLGHHLEIGASIGVAIAPDHGVSTKELMANVDQALYRAKSMGRGCHVVFEGHAIEAKRQRAKAVTT